MRFIVALVIAALVLPFVACNGLQIGTPLRQTPAPPVVIPVTPVTPTPVSGGCVSGAVVDPFSSGIIPSNVTVALEAAYLDNSVYHFQVVGALAHPDNTGAFTVCYPSVPGVNDHYSLVITAADAQRWLFRPVVIPAVTPQSNVGTITLGAGSATVSPATVDVTASSSPTSVSAVVNLYGTADDPLNPPFEMQFQLPIYGQFYSGYSFATVSNPIDCPGLFCNFLSFAVPAQQAAVKVGTTYRIPAGDPLYDLIGSAFSNPGGPCTVWYSESSQTLSGQPLVATPGLHLIASPVVFSGCK